jgi:hypothetical protein
MAQKSHGRGRGSQIGCNENRETWSASDNDAYYITGAKMESLTTL